MAIKVKLSPGEAVAKVMSDGEPEAAELILQLLEDDNMPVVAFLDSHFIKGKHFLYLYRTLCDSDLETLTLLVKAIMSGKYDLGTFKVAAVHRDNDSSGRYMVPVERLVAEQREEEK